MSILKIKKTECDAKALADNNSWATVDTRKNNEIKIRKAILKRMEMDRAEEVVVMLRRIIRATDLRSKQLARESGLTPPQFLILSAIDRLGDVAISQIAKDVNLTQATVTTIIDRLEDKGLVMRVRSDRDKRIVHATLSAEGKSTLHDAPTLLQKQFLDKYNNLKDWEQSFILSALQRVAGLMEAEDIDASPFLDIGDIDRVHEEK